MDAKKLISNKRITLSDIVSEYNLIMYFNGDMTRYLELMEMYIKQEGGPTNALSNMLLLLNDNKS